MPRPEPSYVTLEIDGREVNAPEGAMLVDGAKYGDVEIPYFCYEPKLGAPVGACRMCLVEIEGMPKLQTACSTPVKDGMVVITQSDRVKQAQNAIVEFLLINHPLDCPVCDKGGECPLQDISFGWGAGRSRFVEPKRHFQKPLELSPLVAIDRERCILCYRCVRFSQEISEDYQLVFLDRADHTMVGTHEGHPYVAPFSGNIIELCPVGALTSTAYRFRARPWDFVEDSGSVCALCPSQCNIKFTVRDDSKVMRVLARDNEEVDDGWLCDKGRFGYQAIHSEERITEPLLRDGGVLRPVPWEQALVAATESLGRAGERTAALAGGQTTNEEGFLLQRLVREVLGSPHIDSRPGGPLDPEQARVLARPDLSAEVSDLDYAGAVLVVDTELVDESPILDLRVRKAARRAGVKVVVVTSRPNALDSNADAIVRFVPGAGEAALAALASTIQGVPPSRASAPGSGAPDEGAIADAAVHPTAAGRPQSGQPTSGQLEDLAGRAGAQPEAVARAATLLRGAPPVVVLWGERVSGGERGGHALSALLALARSLDLTATEGAGLLEVPAGTNSRGLREVGCLPGLGPGLADAPPVGGGQSEGVGAAGQEREAPAAAPRTASEIARTLGEDLSALILLHVDPLRTHPARGAWQAALGRASAVVAFSDFLTDSLAEHADVVFPAESYAEKEGTITHPDGRIQRLRQAIGHRGEVRAVWSVLAELAQRLGWSEDMPLTAPLVTAEIARSVPFYEGITLEEIGGRGVRWPDREAAARLPAAELPTGDLETPPERPEGMRLGTAASLWAGPETEHSPVLRFLSPEQRAELSPADASRLGIDPGDEVEVATNGTSVRARAALRDAVPAGSVFLVEGTAEENATALTGDEARTVRVAKA